MSFARAEKVYFCLKAVFNVVFDYGSVSSHGIVQLFLSTTVRLSLYRLNYLTPDQVLNNQGFRVVAGDKSFSLKRI